MGSQDQYGPALGRVGRWLSFNTSQREKLFLKSIKGALKVLALGSEGTSIRLRMDDLGVGENRKRDTKTRQMLS